MGKTAPKTRTVNSGSGHTHYLDGEKVPGVTTIMREGIPKPGLIGWAGEKVADFVVNRLALAVNAEGKRRVVADDLVRDLLEWNSTRGYRAAHVSPSDELPRLALASILKDVRYRDSDEAASRGTDVHTFADRLTRGEEVLVPPELEGHVLAYARFLDEWQPHSAITEFSIVSRRYRYMGRADLIAEFDGVWSSGPWAGRPIGRGLLDIKTNRSGIFAETALQVEAYRNADTLIDPSTGEEVEMPPIDWVGAIWVRSDGYDVYGFDTDESTFRTFLYAKALGEWLDWKEGAAASIRTDALRPPTRTAARLPVEQ